MISVYSGRGVMLSLAFALESHSVVAFAVAPMELDRIIIAFLMWQRVCNELLVF